ncbi:hypothetical protein BC831DRAFT_444865, partial [Entophlyctis helioformis]
MNGTAAAAAAAHTHDIGLVLSCWAALRSPWYAATSLSERLVCVLALGSRLSVIANVPASRIVAGGIVETLGGLANATALLDAHVPDAAARSASFAAPFWDWTLRDARTVAESLHADWRHPPHATHDPILDATLGTDTAARDHARRLMMYAYTSPVSAAHAQEIRSWVALYPQFVHQVGLSPHAFAGLVDHNPTVAGHVLVALCLSPSFSQYLDVLITTSPTIHSMEIVNRVAQTLVLPPVFLHTYLSTAMAACDALRDKFMQNRQARLVCVFIQSLVRNRVLPIAEYGVEIMPFCLAYSRVKEAAALYRLVRKETDGGNGNVSVSASVRG